MAKPNVLPQIAIRVEPELRDQIRIAAAQRYGGNESLLIREATKTYLILMEQFGPTLDILLEALTRPPKTFDEWSNPSSP